ncbi:glycoside hydrolase family 130 protein [Microlunatus sp. Y2014]|uniref:glycoside hydrolase family 130 protein n=1 Tax=Microlunatus sp. Y2014 TaxID=3418488 RepID=UPI003DA70BE5
MAIQRDATRILNRHPANPLIRQEDHPGIAQVFNPSPARVGDETILLVSVVEHAGSRGHGRDVGQTRVARSTDGINFTLGTEDFISPQAAGEPWDLYHHFIDNRVTPIDDWFYIVTPVMVAGFGSPIAMLGRTKDFTTYQRLDTISLPANRGASLFPEMINGRYHRLDRPTTPTRAGDIWLSSSPDLLHWGSTRPVLAAGSRYWTQDKIGSTPPIRTAAGWLVIIHGVFTPAGGTSYHLGAILLDLDEPWRVIGRTNSPLLSPETEYERHGNCDNTVFACGALADADADELWIYYGAADSAVCLATGSLSEVVQACLEGW